MQSRLPAFARLRYPICASGDKSPSRLSTAALPRPPLFRHRRRSGSSPLRGSQGRPLRVRHAGGGRSPFVIPRSRERADEESHTLRRRRQNAASAGDQDCPYGLRVRRRLVKNALFCFRMCFGCDDALRRGRRGDFNRPRIDGGRGPSVILSGAKDPKSYADDCKRKGIPRRRAPRNDRRQQYYVTKRVP